MSRHRISEYDIRLRMSANTVTAVCTTAGRACPESGHKDRHPAGCGIRVRSYIRRRSGLCSILRMPSRDGLLAQHALRYGYAYACACRVTVWQTSLADVNSRLQGLSGASADILHLPQSVGLRSHFNQVYGLCRRGCRRDLLCILAIRILCG